MNPIALYLASGESLYPGCLLLATIAILCSRLRNRWLLRLRNLLAWTALAMMLLACTPYTWPVYAILITSYLLWFVLSNIAWSQTTPRNRKSLLASALLLTSSATAFASFEFPHRILTPLKGPLLDRLVVIGDSVSAGIDAGYDPWPEVFARESHIPVHNLSRPGIGVDEAIPLARKVDASDRWILIEIGGNDLLSNKPAAVFRKELNELLATLAQPGRHLIMFELPLLPHKIEYGSAQRQLAEKYHVTLIPKRLLIEVLGAADATSDGLHLSPNGTRRMAALMHDVFSINDPNTR